MADKNYVHLDGKMWFFKDVQYDDLMYVYIVKFLLQSS